MSSDTHSQVVALRTQGLSVRDIARRTGLSRSAVGRTVRPVQAAERGRRDAEGRGAGGCAREAVPGQGGRSTVAGLEGPGAGALIAKAASVVGAALDRAKALLPAASLRDTNRTLEATARALHLLQTARLADADEVAPVSEQQQRAEAESLIDSFRDLGLGLVVLDDFADDDPRRSKLLDAFPG